MRTALTLSTLLIAFAPAAIAAEPVEVKRVPAGKVFAFLDAYYGLSANARDHFRMEFIQVGAPLPQGFRMTLKRKAGDVPISVGADRRFSPLPSAQDLKAGTELEIAAPKGSKFGLTVKLSPNVAPAENVDAVYLATSVNQARAGTKSVAGAMSFMVPNYQSVCFDGAKSGTVAMANGATSALKLSKKESDVAKGSACFTPSEFPKATRITLDRVPSGLYIVPKPY